MSRYDADDTYCLPGSSVLKNKARISDQDLLDQFEADITAVRLLELAQNPLEGDFNLEHICKIHRYLFQDIYEWAGSIRTVDISRGESRFCNVRQIETYAATLFSSLKAEGHLQDLNKDIFAERAAHYLSEINAIHPFREGNGRVQRLFMSQLAENAGFVLSYAALSRAEMYSAMEAAFFGDEKTLAALIFDIAE